MSEEEKAPAECIAGNHPLIPNKEGKCETCGSTQKLKLCVLCCKAISDDAEYCNDCKSYQGRIRRYWPVSPMIPALLTLLLGVTTGALVPLYSWSSERNSHTFVKVTGADEDHVLMKVWNTGRKPSTLMAFRLTDGKEKFVLDLDPNDKTDAKNVIAFGPPQRIALTNPVLVQSLHVPDNQSKLTLEVDVKESKDLDDPNIDHFTTLKDSFHAALIADFLPKVKKP